MGNHKSNTAYYSDWLYLPKPKFHVPAIKAAFTFETYRKGRVSNRVEAYREDDDYIIVPREFYSEEKLRSIGVRLERQVPDSYEHVEFEDRITLRDDVQREAYKAMIRAGNGVLQLGCGLGKTCLALKYIAHLGVPAIVVVPTADIMEQWREMAKEFLGVEVGIIRGEDKSKWLWKKPLVIAMIQPLSKLSKTLSMDFRRWFGVMAADEVHHLVDYFARTAYLFFGARISLTATVLREDGMHPIFLGHMGPVFYKNLEQPLTPTVYFTSVPVEYPWTTALVHCADKNGEFNLTKMWGLLGEDDKFISACIQLIMKLLREGRKILFLSHRIVTLENLYKRLLPLIPEKVGLITGGEDISIRKNVLKTKMVSLGSMNLAKEGLDSKNLDTLIMEPCKAHGKKGEKESTTFQQATGRILRNYPKQAPEVYVLLPPYAPCYALCNTLKSWCRQRKTPFEIIKEI